MVIVITKAQKEALFEEFKRGIMKEFDGEFIGLLSKYNLLIGEHKRAMERLDDLAKEIESLRSVQAKQSEQKPASVILHEYLTGEEVK